MTLYVLKMVLATILDDLEWLNIINNASSNANPDKVAGLAEEELIRSLLRHLPYSSQKDIKLWIENGCPDDNPDPT
jgi:hypothetical protein